MTKSEAVRQLKARGVTGANNAANKDAYTVEQIVDMLFEIFDLELTPRSKGVHEACMNYEGSDF